MRHIKADDVDYADRPKTLKEMFFWSQIESFKPGSPQWWQMWINYLHERQITGYPLEDFCNILEPDFEDHRAKCLDAEHHTTPIDRAVTTIEMNWRYGFKDRDDQYAERFHTWKQGLDFTNEDLDR